jgi:hypothetical protein
MAGITPLQFRTADLPGMGAVAMQNLNTFFSQVQKLLKNGLTLGANVNASVVAQSFTTNSTALPGTNLSSPLTFAHKLTGRCTNLLVGQMVATGLFTPPFAPTWSDDGKGNVVVTCLAGLKASTAYTCNFICLAG